MYLDQPNRPIEINPAHKGKFTEWCMRHGFSSVQQGAKHVLANKQHYPEDVVKMANFAHNSKQWGKGAPKRDDSSDAMDTGDDGMGGSSEDEMDDRA